MSLPVATTVSGIDSMKVLKQNLRDRSGLPADDAQTQMTALPRHASRSWAADGRFELYKTTAKHEGDEGRRQHGFPTSDQAAL